MVKINNGEWKYPKINNKYQYNKIITTLISWSINWNNKINKVNSIMIKINNVT